MVYGEEGCRSTDVQQSPWFVLRGVQSAGSSDPSGHMPNGRHSHTDAQELTPDATPRHVLETTLLLGHTGASAALRKIGADEPHAVYTPGTSLRPRNAICATVVTSQPILRHLHVHVVVERPVVSRYRRRSTQRRRPPPLITSAGARGSIDVPGSCASVISCPSWLTKCGWLSACSSGLSVCSELSIAVLVTKALELPSAECRNLCSRRCDELASRARVRRAELSRAQGTHA
jgi:hypothetical protein